MSPTSRMPWTDVSRESRMREIRLSGLKRGEEAVRCPSPTLQKWDWLRAKHPEKLQKWAAARCLSHFFNTLLNHYPPRLIVSAYRMITAPAERKLQGAHSGGTISRPPPPSGAGGDPKSVAGADSSAGAASPASSNRSTARHSAPKMHIVMPMAKKNARHIDCRLAV